MTLQMPKTLQLEAFTEGMGLPEIIRVLNRNNEELKSAYQRIWSEVRFKEFVYFTRGKKLWRLGPVGDHLEAQYFIGTDIQKQWRDNSLWQMEWRSYGGADA